MIYEIEKYLKTKANDYEIFLSRNESLLLKIEKEKIGFISQGESEGYGVRVFINGKMGFCSSQNIKNFKQCVDNAIKIANLNNKDEKFKNFVPGTKIKSINNYNKELWNLSPEYAKNIIQGKINIIKDFNKKIKVAEGSYSLIKSNIKILNSNGVDAEENSCTNSIDCQLILDNASIYYTDSSNEILKNKKPLTAAKRVLANTKKNTPKTGKYKIILDPEAVDTLFRTGIGFSVNAENIQQKKSYFTDKLNKQVASKLFSITDDAISPELISSRPFDDEGVKSKKIKLIENGILKNFLYDSYHAFIEGKESTGHASRTFASTPSIEYTNLCINSGKKTKQELFNEINKGLYIKTLLGAHSMDPSTGDFSLGISDGDWIEKGEPKHALENTMIAASFFEILNNILSLSNKKEFGLTSVYSPFILIDNQKIIGN